MREVEHEMRGARPRQLQHWFEAERISSDYGSELDVLLQAKWHHFSGTIKYADYRADHFATDTTKFWAQIEYAW